MRILLALAVLPAVLLMIYVYNKDTVEKEPPGLLALMALAGALACIPASISERVFLSLLGNVLPSGSLLYSAVETFVIVAISEEGCKLFFLKKLTWRSRDFNYRFDGIVYAVFVSLGFAALENILYVFNYGPSVLINRGLLAIPGHMTFAVFMGLHYSEAKLAALRGDEALRRRAMRLSLLMPCLLHGFYDFCLMSGLEILSAGFIAFVVILDVVAFRTVNRVSRTDEPLPPDDPWDR